MNTINNNNNYYMDEIEVILKKIEEIQKRSVREEIQEKYCDYDFLEDDERCNDKNTRPIQIYTNDDKPWFCPIHRNDVSCKRPNGCSETSCVFRVEKIENGSVYLRVLTEKDYNGADYNKENEKHNNNKKHEKFEATDSFITIKIDKIAAIRCLKDTFVDICLRNR